MPALRTLIDGVPIATVSSDGYNLLSVRVSGTRINEELATIEVSGGIYPEGGESTYLIWAADIHLLPNQEVTVQYLEKAETSHPGKTIDEQYPDEPSCEEEDFTPTPEMFTKLRTMPTFRDGFKLFLESSQGAHARVDTTPEDHGFAFSVDWNSFRPQHARMSLHSYTIQSMEDRTDSTYHVQEKMNCGDEVKFALFA